MAHALRYLKYSFELDDLGVRVSPELKENPKYLDPAFVPY